MIDYAKIDVSVLKDYLLLKGWIEVPIKREEVLKFRAPTSLLVDGDNGIKTYKQWDVFIPSNRRLADYKLAIQYAVEAIAVYERRTLPDVDRDIMEMQNDISKQRDYSLNEPVIQIYSPESYHTEAAIVLNEEGRKALIEALQRNEPDMVIQAFINDGEGFDLRIAVLPEPDIRKMQVPYLHDWKDTTLIDPRDFDASK